MKKIILLIAISVFCYQLHAAKYRVNNTGGSAQFSNIFDAHNAASAGDTIYIEGSPVLYIGITITKPLVIIGPGYFLEDNPQTQANLYDARVQGITFNTGSAGSIIMGLHVWNSGASASLITVNESNIVIRRNYLDMTGPSGYSPNTIRINSGKNNIIIEQNFLELKTNGGPTIKLEGNNTGIVINNNFIFQSAGTQAINVPSTSTAQISNNVIAGSMIINNSNVHNNIMTGGGITQTSCIFTNNIGNSTQFSEPDNLQNIDMNLVFDATEPSRDGKYRLINDVSNPALGYGMFGVDCGMFGGNSPYMLSGIPPVPAVFFFYTSPSGSEGLGLPSSIKVKTNR